MSNPKQSFLLYYDIRGPLELLSDEDRGKLFLGVLNYAEYGTVPDYCGALQIAFAFLRTAIDRDASAWEAKREKRREAGSRGGQQTAANRASAVFAGQPEQNQANQSVPVPAPGLAPVPAPVLSPDRGNKADKPSRAARFTPPTVEDVREYCLERGNQVEPERFVDFYASKGWKVGNQPMKDWKAAVRNWERSGNNNHVEKSGNVFFEIAREEGLM